MGVQSFNFSVCHWLRKKPSSTGPNFTRSLFVKDTFVKVLKKGRKFLSCLHFRSTAARKQSFSDFSIPYSPHGSSGQWRGGHGRARRTPAYPQCCPFGWQSFLRLLPPLWSGCLQPEHCEEQRKAATVCKQADAHLRHSSIGNVRDSSMVAATSQEQSMVNKMRNTSPLYKKLWKDRSRD